MYSVGVVTFPGSNCDADFRDAISQVSGLRAVGLWHKDHDLHNVDAVVLPGGFSYGDYLRCGAIARFSPIMSSIIQFANQGRPVLGVCNGFQILCETKLLPGALLRNRDLSFRCQDTWLVVGGQKTPFTHQLQGVLRLPIAHGEGNWTVDEHRWQQMNEREQILFRYVTSSGDVCESANPNGAKGNVAGICNERGNVVGLMPHPERVCDASLGGTDGIGFLTSLLAHLC